MKVMKNYISFILFLFVYFLTISGCIKRTVVKEEKNNNSPLSELIQGNQRFYTNQTTSPHAGTKRMIEISDQQDPFAVVVSCADSRLSPELIFDQGLGDLFVIRNAGNIITGIELGSIEYAIVHLRVPLIVIMGHQNCGAIQGYLGHGHAEGHIKDIMDSLANEPEIDQLSANGIHETDLFVRANVMHAVNQVKSQSSIVQKHIQDGTVRIVGAFYNVHTGRVSPI